MRKIIERYPQRHSHIDPNDVEVVINTDALQSKTIARINIVPPKFQPFLGEILIIEMWQCHIEELTKEALLIVLDHELEHIEPYEGRASYDKKYKAKDHDIQEFGTFIEMFGLKWTHRTDLPNILKERVKIKRVEEHSGVLG